MAHAQPPSSDNSITGAANFYINDKDLKNLIKKAKSGDDEAALKIYRHFSLGAYNAKESNYWLNFAANLNNIEAQYDLAYSYLLKGDLENSEKWAQKSFDSGKTQAKELLNEIQEKRLARKK